MTDFTKCLFCYKSLHRYNSRHSGKTKNQTSSINFRLIQNLILYMSCADGGNFLWKKFHKTSHTLHSLITCKQNLKRVNSLCTCITDYIVVILSEVKESSLFNNLTAQTILVLLFVLLTSYCSFRYRGKLTP